MAKTETTLSIFVASPADVAEERTIVDDVISELNLTWANSLGIRLEALRYETHAFPGVSTDAQSVINEEVSNNFDIFLGIMWTRLGTKTPRADSGTLEEFERAYTRFKQNPQTIRIMFYFKSTPVSPDDIDPAQIGLIKEFRRQLGEKGALYWTYNTIEEFRDLLRMHLSRQIQEWNRSWGRPDVTARKHVISKSSIGAIGEENQVATSTEEGFLDLIEDGESSFVALTESSGKIGEYVADLGHKIESRTREIQEVSNQGQKGYAGQKKIINRSAEDLETFVARMKTEIPIYSESLNKGLNSWARATTLLPQFQVNEIEDIENAIRIVEELQPPMRTAIKSIFDFREVINALPPVTIQFNRARRQTVVVLDEFIAETEKGLNLLPEIAKTMKNVSLNISRMGQKQE